MPAASASSSPAVDGSSTERLLANIDFLRGASALAILFWHYQHFYFFMPGVLPPDWRASQQPLFEWFSAFYLYGDHAVTLFWLISGFVFFHVYADRRSMGTNEFFVARFSRLYPLHLVTLIVIAALQIFSFRQFGRFQIFPDNDLRHFFLQLAMVSTGNSFNMPVWSVTVELCSYALFFIYLTRLGVGLTSAIVWTASALSLYWIIGGPTLHCAACFALGGTIRQICLLRWGRLSLSVAAGFILALGGAFAFACEHRRGFSPGVLDWWALPSLLWVFATLEERGLSLGKVGTWFGSITYASYLIHIPVQIILLMVLDGVIRSRAVVQSPVFLGLYMVGVVALALLTFRFVELPLKHWTRRLMTPRDGLSLEAQPARV